MLRRFILWLLRDDLVNEVRLLEIETEWRDLLQRMAAAAAREGKAARRRLKTAHEPETQPPATTPPPMTRKALLRQRAAAARGIGLVGVGDIPEAVENESRSQNS